MTLIAWFFVAALAYGVWPWLIAALLLAGVAHVLRAMATTASELRELARAAGAVLAARAEVETALVLAGDERGVYGQYEPVNAKSAPALDSEQNESSRGLRRSRFAEGRGGVEPPGWLPLPGFQDQFDLPDRYPPSRRAEELNPKHAARTR